MSDELTNTIKKHWYADQPGSLLSRIDAALVEAGKNPTSISADDLLAVDEFHIRGREATQEMAALAAIQATETVLDVGSGIGGPSRFLATRSGCHVTGVDLTAEYCDTANTLAKRVGLEDRVRYQQGDALDLPFTDASFDVAWTQHISMNIPDKQRFFDEMFRVVKPGGRVAIYDPIAGNGEPLRFPVPWSRDGDISFLINTEQTQARLAEAGFAIVEWHDVSQRSLDWFQAQAASGAPPSPLNLVLLLGAEWSTMAANMVRNIAEGRLAVVQVIARRPA